MDVKESLQRQNLASHAQEQLQDTRGEYIDVSVGETIQNDKDDNFVRGELLEFDHDFQISERSFSFCCPDIDGARSFSENLRAELCSFKDTELFGTHTTNVVKEDTISMDSGYITRPA